VANYLTIPEMVEAETILSLSAHPDGRTFDVLIGVGETAVQLARFNTEGREIPLVVLTTDAQVLALDDVFVAAVQFSGEPAEQASVTFAAQAVRFF